MKIVRYAATASAAPQWGSVVDGRVHPLSADPLSNGRPQEPSEPIDKVHLFAPCQPAKVMALAVNYEGSTGWTEGMKEPLVFLKANTSVCGPRDEIRSPFGTTNVWGEAELAIVIGRRLRGASDAEAKVAIFGYTAANDVSADNFEGWDHHLARSKAADTFCPLGPWIDTEYDPKNRAVEAWQRGELIRRGNTDQRLWSDVHTVALLSRWMTLEPWDVILTGTPPRVVPRRYLKEGEEFVVRIEGLGELKNVFLRDPVQEMEDRGS